LPKKEDYNLGGLFLGKTNSGVQNIGAKKLDINFDSDDFFNQFDPQVLAKQQEEKEREGLESKRKLEEERKRKE